MKSGLIFRNSAGPNLQPLAAIVTDRHSINSIMTKTLILVFIVLTSPIYGQSNKSKWSWLSDTVWAKANFFRAKVEFVSIEKYPVRPCGGVQDATSAKFKIITTDNDIVNPGQIYNFHIGCATLSSKPTQGQIYNIQGVLNFNDKDSLGNLNSFKGFDPNKIYLVNIYLQTQK